jgi:peptidoglycan/xylan/chitin deacetylase (PgdA/CDA1 family)
LVDLQERPAVTRAVVAAPAVAATIVALVGLIGGEEPAGSSHSARHVAPATPPVTRRVDTGPGPPALVAAARRELATPLGFKRVGSSFLTVTGRLGVISDAPKAGRKVALTFDDGPGPLTRAFLHRLRRLHAKATFFPVGYAIAARPHVLREIRAAGMSVGNHTITHPLMARLPADRQRVEIEGQERTLQRMIGYRPLFFRPPYRSYSLVTAREIAEAGMVGVLWSVDSEDYTRPGVRRIVRNALTVKAGGVILMHDFGGDRSQTLAALPKIVRRLRRRGLEPVTLDDLYRQASPP